MLHGFFILDLGLIHRLIPILLIEFDPRLSCDMYRMSTSINEGTMNRKYYRKCSKELVNQEWWNANGNNGGHVVRSLHVLPCASNWWPFLQIFSWHNVYCYDRLITRVTKWKKKSDCISLCSCYIKKNSTGTAVAILLADWLTGQKEKWISTLASTWCSSIHTKSLIVLLYYTC